VAVNVWRIISDVLSVELGCNDESVARFWIANKKHLITNVISSVVLWSLWKLRNELCFQGGGMDWDEDGADSNHKNAKRMIIAVQEGSWRADRRSDCRIWRSYPGARRKSSGGRKSQWSLHQVWFLWVPSP
jgi:hypothetical protein